MANGVIIKVLRLLFTLIKFQVSIKENKHTRKKRRIAEYLRKEASFNYEPKNVVTNERNPTETLAKAFACQLQEMTKVQRCLAEKLMAEVLFYGKLDLLTFQSTIALNNDNCNTTETKISIPISQCTDSQRQSRSQTSSPLVIPLTSTSIS